MSNDNSILTCDGTYVYNCEMPAAGYIETDGDPIICCDRCATKTTASLVRWPLECEDAA